MPSWEGRLSAVERKILALYLARSEVARPMSRILTMRAHQTEGRDLAAGRRRRCVALVAATVISSTSR